MNKPGTMLIRAVFAVGLAGSSASFGQTIPKRANFEATYNADVQIVASVDAGNSDALRLYEISLAFTNSSNAPLFQDISASCVESAFTGAGESGYCVYIDKDGDKFVQTLERPAGAKVGHGVFGSGTGKYAGITGKVSWEIQGRPTETNRSISFVAKMTGNYQLP